jgi:hypothetical protein
MSVQTAAARSAKPMLVVVDFEDYTRGGGFGQCCKIFCAEFARRFDEVSLYTPSPESTIRLFQGENNPAPPNLSLLPLPKMRRKQILFGRRRKCTLENVLTDHSARFPGRSRACFVMYGYDLLEGRIGDAPTAAPWGTLSCLSWWERGYTNEAGKVDLALKQLCLQRNDCAVVLTGDQFILGPGLPKALWVNCPEDYRLPETAPSELDQLKQLSAGRPIIASVGILSGPRCVNEMLRLAKANPSLFFLLAGRLHKDSVEPDLAPLLEDRKPENLLIISGFLAQLTHNALVNACDALFVNGPSHPVHSSVSGKALYYGKFLLTPESNSWTCDAIKKWDVGLAYNGSEMNFTEAWQRWKTNGGVERSREAGRKLMNPESVKSCFDQVSSILMESAR